MERDSNDSGNHLTRGEGRNRHESAQRQSDVQELVESSDDESSESFVEPPVDVSTEQQSDDVPAPEIPSNKSTAQGGATRESDRKLQPAIHGEEFCSR